MSNYINNTTFNSNELIKILKNGKKNIIFGAGAIGSIFKKAINDIGIEVNCFLVNDGHRKEKSHLGIPVCELSEFSMVENQCNILVAIRCEKEIALKEVKKRFINNIYNLDYINDIVTLKECFYLDYFNKRNIDISNEIIIINSFKLVNPFLKGVDYKLASLLEFDDLIIPEVLNDYSKVDEGNYELGNVKLNENDVVIDCGANVGLFSAIAAFKGCKVYAFEPFNETIKYLKEVSRLYPNQIEICKYALSNKVGISSFNVIDGFIAGNSLCDTNLNLNDYEIKVPVTTIDEYVKENRIDKVDFIKADIEGSERYMLMGAVETLKQFEPKLSICVYHLEDDPEVIENIIKNANPNYIIERKWKKLYAYVPK